MKKILLLLSIIFLLKESKSQICNFTYSQTGNSVTFQLPPMITIYVLDSVNWVFGDGNNLYQYAPSFSNPTHIYANPGVYNACLNFWYHQIGSSVALFCTTCQPITIAASGPCNASFVFTTSGSTVGFTSTSSGPGLITNHSWNFGDGSPISTLTNPTHTYAAAGNYTVCHTIVGVDSSSSTFTCTDCDTVSIGGTTPCNASYIFNQSGNNVTFTSTSSGPGTITGHNWNFGDGSPNSTAPNPLHTYASPGTYIACHTITGGTSTVIFTCTFCDTIIIPATGPCNASFNFTISGSNANFTSTSSGPGTITNHSWNFGDGSPLSTAVNPGHTYALPGLYNVCHTIVGIDSSSTTFTCTFCDSITIGGTIPCNASFIFNQSGNNVTFTSTSSGPGPITGHTWIFGDGSPNSNLPNPLHTYTSPGAYTVCHIITGSSSAGIFTCTFCDTILISASSPCLVNANFNFSVSGLTANFTNTTTCTGCTSLTYSWDFGDGSAISTLTNPSRTYSVPNSYTVCLRVTGMDSSSNICKDTLCKTVTVTAPGGISNLYEYNLEMYPNPTQGISKIILPVGEKFEALSVYDIAGRKMRNLPYIQSTQNEILIDFSSLEPGSYFVKVRLEDEKVIKGSIMKN